MKEDTRPIKYFIICVLINALVPGLLSNIVKNQDIIDVLNIIITIISNLILAILLFILYKNKLKEDYKNIDLKKIIITVISAIIIIVVGGLISGLLIKSGIKMQNEESVNEGLLKLQIPMMIYVALIVPFNEEFVFRYSLGSIKSKTLFLILTTVLFGIVHSTKIDFIVFAFYGLCLGIIYLKTNKNVLVTIAIHILNNFLSMIL